MSAVRALEVVGAILGCLVSLGVIVRAIRGAGRQLAAAAERKIEDKATEVAATIAAAIIEQVGGVDRRLQRLEYRVRLLEEHAVR